MVGVPKRRHNLVKSGRIKPLLLLGVGDQGRQSRRRQHQRAQDRLPPGRAMLKALLTQPDPSSCNQDQRPGFQAQQDMHPRG